MRIRVHWYRPVGLAARAQALIARESYVRIGVGFDMMAFEVVEGQLVAGAPLTGDSHWELEVPRAQAVRALAFLHGCLGSDKLQPGELVADAHALAQVPQMFSGAEDLALETPSTIAKREADKNRYRRGRAVRKGNSGTKASFPPRWPPMTEVALILVLAVLHLLVQRHVPRDQPESNDALAQRHFPRESRLSRLSKPGEPIWLEHEDDAGDASPTPPFRKRN
jgi:hypothetical protein